MYQLLSIKHFLSDLRKQKMRTFMTTCGILWGTLSVVLLMAFGTGLYDSQMKSFRGLGENISIVWPGMTSKPWQGLPKGRNIRFTEDDISKMKATISSISRISPEYSRSSVSIKSEKNNLLARVVGVWPEFGDMRNLIPQSGGRYINSLDMIEKRRVIFIGNRLAEKLFGDKNPVGETILVKGVPFVVIGVMKSKKQDSSYSGRDHSQTWIPSTTFMTMWTRRYPNLLIAQTESLLKMPRAKKDLYNFMAGKYKFDPEDTEALSVWDTTESLQFFSSFFLAFRAFLVAIGCMTLITGGIGVSNIMNVVLEERTKEIGIKMALGAKKVLIMTQFIFETALITAIGGGVGLGLGILIVNVCPPELTEYIGIPTLNIEGALLAILILGIVSLTAGFFPARRAANLEPVKALKLF